MTLEQFKTGVAHVAHTMLMAHYRLAAQHAADAHLFAVQLYEGNLPKHAVRMQEVAAKAYEAKVMAARMIETNRKVDADGSVE